VWKIINYPIDQKSTPFSSVPYAQIPALTLGTFVDTNFHASRSGWHNRYKQPGFPSIWGSGANGQLGQKSTTGLVVSYRHIRDILSWKITLSTVILSSRLIRVLGNTLWHEAYSKNGQSRQESYTGLVLLYLYEQRLMSWKLDYISLV
jgi:hypothetical protein